MNDTDPSLMATLPEPAEALLARLEALGIAAATTRHAPVFTVAESQSLRGVLPGTHCKCLFLRNKKGAMWLVVAEESRPIDLKALAGLLNAGRLSFASPDRLRRHLGVEPGSVTPFALINDPDRAVSVVIDRGILDGPLVNFHPLVNTATTALAPDDLMRFIADCGHEPSVVDLAAAAP